MRDEISLYVILSLYDKVSDFHAQFGGKPFLLSLDSLRGSNDSRND
jgi:hypothetical protein